MPLTFPSHAAAILPLLHLPGTRRLSPAGLIVGSTAPDLIYLIGTHGADAHRPWGLLTFCLPAGLLAFLYLEGLLLPVLGPLIVALFPRSWQRVGIRIVGPRALPRTLVGWFGISLAILLGAATHQFWDGFTHAWMWPARILYPDLKIPLFGHLVMMSKLLQHLSSILGAGAVLYYLYRLVPSSSANKLPQGGRTGPARQLWYLVLLPLFGGIVAGAARFLHPDPLLTRAAWNAAWAAVAWFALLLGATCLFVRIGQLVRQAAVPPQDK